MQPEYIDLNIHPDSWLEEQIKDAPSGVTAVYKTRYEKPVSDPERFRAMLTAEAEYQKENPWPVVVDEAEYTRINVYEFPQTVETITEERESYYGVKRGYPKPIIIQKDKMPDKHDGIALDDSYLFTGLSEEQRDFIQDNEKQILTIVSRLIQHPDCTLTIESQRRDIVLIEYAVAETF